MGRAHGICQEALTELIAFVETDVAANWPARRAIIKQEVRTAALKTRMGCGGGLARQEFKGVVLGEQQFPAIRGTTTDAIKAELLRGVHIAAADHAGRVSICDDRVTWTDADLMVGHSRPPMPGLVGGIDDGRFARRAHADFRHRRGWSPRG